MSLGNIVFYLTTLPLALFFVVMFPWYKCSQTAFKEPLQQRNRRSVWVHWHAGLLQGSCVGGGVGTWEGAELIFMLAPNTAVFYPLSYRYHFLDWWNSQFVILAGRQRMPVSTSQEACTV